MSETIANHGIRPHVRLTANQVQVWCASLDMGAADLQDLTAHLSREEQERAALFSIAIERDRFIAARGILRELLGSYVQRQPRCLLIETSARGKPHLGHPSGAFDVRFNLSHSHGLALFAFSLGREVGIDIEKIRPEFLEKGIVERYFSPQERTDLQATPKEQRADAFFRCWTRKEAYLKARGDGLYGALGNFSVSLQPSEPPQLWSVDREDWKLYSLEKHAGFVGALVVEGPECQVLYSRWRYRGSNLLDSSLV